MEDVLVAFEDTEKTTIAFVVIDDVLNTSAETSKAPPPLSDENGDCEKALIPNIILNVHYLIAKQKELLFLNLLPKRIS